MASGRERLVGIRQALSTCLDWPGRFPVESEGYLFTRLRNCYFIVEDDVARLTRARLLQTIHEPLHSADECMYARQVQHSVNSHARYGRCLA